MKIKIIIVWLAIVLKKRKSIEDRGNRKNCRGKVSVSTALAFVLLLTSALLETISLRLLDGSAHNGTWQADWLVHAKVNSALSNFPVLINLTADTTLYMYYNNSGCGSQQNATGVWNTNYKGMWHLQEDSVAVREQVRKGKLYIQEIQNIHGGEYYEYVAY